DIWKTNKNSIIKKNSINQPHLENTKQSVSCLAFSPDSKNIIIGYDGNDEEDTLISYKIKDNGSVEKNHTLQNSYSQSVNTIVFDPTGKKFASVINTSGGITIWNIDKDGNAFKLISLLEDESFD